MGERGIDRGCVAGLLVLGALLKFTGLGAHGLSGDEPFTVYWAQRPLGELFAMLRTENNPPLYFLLMHAWSTCVPLDEAWLRVPSALFSVLTVWPLYLLARRGGRTTAVTAGLLFTLSQHHYAFAHEVRAYALLVLACVWSTWLLVRAAEPGRRPSAWAWLAVAELLLTWTHFFGWLMVGLQVLFVVLVPGLRPARRALGRAVALTALTHVPYAAVLFGRASSSIVHGTWLEAPGWEEPYNMLMRWSNAPVVAVCFLAVVVLALMRRPAGPTGPGPMRMALLWCGVPLVGMFLVSFAVPVYLDRYLLFASIGWYLLVAQAVAGLLPQAKGRRLLAGAAVAGMAASFAPWRPPSTDPGGVVRQVEAWRRGRTAVIVQPGWYGITYAWYLDRRLFRERTPIDQLLRARDVFPLASPDQLQPDPAWDTVVLVDAWAGLTDPEGRTERTVRSRWSFVDEVEADRKVRLLRFHR